MNRLRERMGSGGPRGLQILRSGASGVRGGFDSHAFPPLFLAAWLLACACLAAPVAARAADGAPRDTSAAARRVRWTEQPRVVMLRSLVVPGWGQWHNRAHLKAAVVAGVEGWIVGGMVSDQAAMNRVAARAHQATDLSDPNLVEYNSRLDSFVSGQWLLGGVLAYALVDAYVDAHFRTFDADFRVDPALPRDAAPAGPPAPGRGRGGARTRLSLEWHF